MKEKCPSSLKHNDHDQGEYREWNRQIAGYPLRSLQYGAVKAWSFCWNSRKDWIDVWRQNTDTVVSSQWDFHAHPQASHLVLSCACITFLFPRDLISFPGKFRSNNSNGFNKKNKTCLPSTSSAFAGCCHLFAAPNSGVNFCYFRPRYAVIHTANTGDQICTT